MRSICYQADLYGFPGQCAALQSMLLPANHVKAIVASRPYLSREIEIAIRVPVSTITTPILDYQTEGIPLQQVFYYVLPISFKASRKSAEAKTIGLRATAPSSFSNLIRNQEGTIMSLYALNPNLKHGEVNRSKKEKIVSGLLRQYRVAIMENFITMHLNLSKGIPSCEGIFGRIRCQFRL